MLKRLTDTELTVVGLHSKGFSTRAIALMTKLTDTKVAMLLERAARKVGVYSRHQLNSAFQYETGKNLV